MDESSGGIGGLIVLIIYLGVIVLLIASMWRVFTKAGEPGWTSIIPIYNAIVFLRIAGKPWWWLLLMLIPLVGIVIAIMATVSLANRFGKGVGFAMGLLFLGFIFYPILAFGDAQYQGDSL